MKTLNEQIREILVKAILEGGEQVERAVSDGPRATLDAIEGLIDVLNAQADTIAIVIAAGPCNLPDCPNCGQAARDSAPINTPAPLN